LFIILKFEEKHSTPKLFKSLSDVLYFVFNS
jgi:hypothetical protein